MHVLAEDRFEPGPERGHAVRRPGLEAPVLVRPKCDGRALEAHVADLKAQDLRMAPAGEQERRDQWEQEGQGGVPALRRVRAGTLGQERALVDLVEARSSASLA